MMVSGHLLSLPPPHNPSHSSLRSGKMSTCLVRPSRVSDVYGHFSKLGKVYGIRIGIHFPVSGSDQGCLNDK